MKSSAYVVFFILALLALSHAIVIDTPIGRIEGKQSDLGGQVFRGIPYSQADRFERGTSVAPFTSTFQAFTDYPACPQDCVLPPNTCPEVVDEDCLGVNIFTPRNVGSNHNYPVMVYFHGGNFFQGFGGGPLYNGTYISSVHEVIIVTVNYRLGALGFYADDEAGMPHNLAIYDQIDAIKWVRRVIPSFGGDINRITLFGQSAGAASIATLITSPLAKGLFHRAIMLSNPFAIPFQSAKTYGKFKAAFRKHSGCDTKQCYKSLSVRQILDAQQATQTDFEAIGDNLLLAFLPWSPYVGDELVPEHPILAFGQGRAMDIPVIIGTVYEEAILFINQAFETPMDEFGYMVFASLIFGDRAGRVLDRYPALKTGDNRQRLNVVGNHFVFDCATKNATQNFLARSQSPGQVYNYVFNHTMSFGSDSWGKYTECYDKSCHGGELPFLWDSAHWLHDYTPQEKQLAKSMGQYFVNFATTGNPNLSASVSSSLLAPYDEDAYVLNEDDSDSDSDSDSYSDSNVTYHDKSLDITVTDEDIEEMIELEDLQEAVGLDKDEKEDDDRRGRRVDGRRRRHHRRCPARKDDETEEEKKQRKECYRRHRRRHDKDSDTTTLDDAIEQAMGNVTSGGNHHNLSMRNKLSASSMSAIDKHTTVFYESALPTWEPYAAASGVMHINIQHPGMMNYYQYDICKFWDSIGYVIP